MNDFDDLIYKYLKADYFESISERNKILEEIMNFLMEDFQVNRETAIEIWTKYIVAVTKDYIIRRYKSVKELITIIKENK